jgi:hypothetical protein
MYNLEVLNAQLGNLKSQFKKKQEKILTNKAISEAEEKSIILAVQNLRIQIKEKQKLIEAEYDRIKPKAKNKNT